MRDIAVVMVVAGSKAYFDFASYSVSSFLKNNPTTDLFVFTDNADEINKAVSGFYRHLHVIDYLPLLEQHKEIVEMLEQRGWCSKTMHEHEKKYGYTHKNVLVTALNPIADSFLKESERYSHILKIDSDSYFCGGDMMKLVKEEVKKASPDIDLFLVERTHDLMRLYAGGKPGSGFTLWRKGGRFIAEYLKQFNISAQVTIIKMKEQYLINIKMLARPGFHFVYPFDKAKRTGKVFTKEIAAQFLPAYYHLDGTNALENMKKMKEWFGNA